MSDQELKSMRRSVFIKKAFQGRFIAWVLLMIILFGLCSAAILYGLIGGELESQTQSAHINIANVWNRLGISILIGNVAAAMVAGLTAIIVVLYISHKIAGPLYRFETLCHQVGNGQLEAKTSLREHDQLQDLSQAFAYMVDRLRVRRDERLELIKQLRTHLESPANIPPQSAETISTLLSHIENLDQS